MTIYDERCVAGSTGLPELEKETATPNMLSFVAFDAFFFFFSFRTNLRVQSDRGIGIAECFDADESQPHQGIRKDRLAVLPGKVGDVPKVFRQLQEALKERGRLVKGIACQPGLTGFVELRPPPKGSVCFSNHRVPSNRFVDELREG